jgi:hypothetical protein
MRFNNRACALMDIPDLPQEAFEHCGDGKIKPQGGGGGGIVSAITDPISDVLGTSGGGGGILGAVEDVGQAVGDVGESFDKAVTQPIGGALADVDKFVNEELPGGWLLPAAVTAAIAAPYAAPYLAGEGVGAAAFTGATETGLATLAGEGAATAAAQAAAAEAAGATLLNEAVTAAATEAATQALPYTVAADAANLAANGFDAATIAQNLTATGVDYFVAADAANLAAQGLSEAAIAQNLAQGYTAAELGGTGIKSTLPSLSKPFITPGQALQLGRMGMGLLGGGQRQQPQMPQMQMSQPRTRLPQGTVDYGGIYNLLALQRAKNPNSLLG